MLSYSGNQLHRGHPAFSRRSALRLFCFPYAGGNAQIYRDWKNYLPRTVDLYPVELPGHGRRWKEPLVTDFPSLVQNLADSMQHLLDLPFAVFGHSMGAIIAFEISHYIRREFGRQPAALFVAGRRPPQVTDSESLEYRLPTEEFIAELRRLKGTPEELLNNPEAMEIVIPIVRADLELLSTYSFTEREPLWCPIHAFACCREADIRLSAYRRWAELTHSAFSLSVIKGGHFFIHSSQRVLLNRLVNKLSAIIEKTKGERQ